MKGLQRVSRVGQDLRELRGKRTLAQIANAARVSKGALSHTENGTRDLGSRGLARVLTACGATADQSVTILAAHGEDSGSISVEGADRDTIAACIAALERSRRMNGGPDAGVCIECGATIGVECAQACPDARKRGAA